MEEPRTYTLDEVEEETGFDKRTIAYYVQEGLLPKVGRRGPRTRYPRLFVDRLLFVKRLRELQDEGVTGNLTLGEMRRIFERVPDDVIADVVAGEEDLRVVDLAHRAGEGSDMAAAGRRAQVAASRMRAVSHADPPAPEELSADDLWIDERVSFSRAPELADTGVMEVMVLDEPGVVEVEDDLASLLRRLNQATSGRAYTDTDRPQRWTRTWVTPGITLSAHDINDEGVALLEAVAERLRRLAES